MFVLKLKKVGAILAVFASPAVAQPQSPAPAACLTDVEARALFTYAIPEALDGVSKQCKATLPATSFLATRSGETIARFRVAATASWPTARGAFVKIAGPGEATKVIASMPDAALQPFVAAAFSSVFANDVKPDDCPKIDRFVSALAPLAPATVAELIVALVGLAGKKESEDFKLC